MNRSEIVKIATYSSSRVLAKVKPDYVHPIDVFSIIESLGIVLNFQPLGNLAGAYIPPETSYGIPGILINERLPLTLQRYSAAHELCHYLRKDPASIDTSEEIRNPVLNRTKHEVLAEYFASSLLMPRPLIRNTLEKITNDCQKKNIGPIEAYSLSLRLGVSYQAIVHRLRAINIINDHIHSKLIEIVPKTIKAQFGSELLESSWNDIWNISSLDRGISIYPRIGDVVIFSLPENPTTGYKWIEPKYNQQLELLESYWEGNTDNVGASGIRTMKFKVGQSDVSIFNLIYARSWDVENHFKDFNIYIRTQNKRHGISELLAA